MAFLRRHFVTIITLTLGLIIMVAFTWGDWHTYAAEQQAHHETADFWSVDYLANWVDQALQNWQSELIFGVWLAYQIQRGQKSDE